MKSDSTTFNQSSPKHEYSPNNNTNQNIEQYNKHKLLLNQFNYVPQEPSQYSNYGYIPGASYQMLPNYNVKTPSSFSSIRSIFLPLITIKII